ncbi:MAG: hypothetical protein NPIRA01_35970 [Nitrospirales bacterium]|nr:MAG: hypothetical protein NPIRA01_35970 [Nitrospirales bacterium]
MNALIKKVYSYFPKFQGGLQEQFEDLFDPQLKHRYFLNNEKQVYRFNIKAQGFDPINAAWMADAALLVYVPNPLDNFRTLCKSPLN